MNSGNKVITGNQKSTTTSTFFLTQRKILEIKLKTSISPNYFYFSTLLLLILDYVSTLNTWLPN